MADSTNGVKNSLRGWWLFFLGLGLGGAGGYLAASRPPAEIATTSQEGGEATPAAAVSASDGGEIDAGADAGPAAAAGEEKAPVGPLDEARLLSVTLTGSLSRTLADQLGQRDADVLAAHLSRLLVWWLDLRRDVLEGDRLRVLYLPHQEPEKVRVLALRYASEKLGGEKAAYYFRLPGARCGRYYDEEGQEIELRLEASPIDDYEQITERLNLSGRRHRGIDFKAQIGTPVFSPYRARVVRRNWQSRGNGNCLELRYLESSKNALFLHLDSLEPDVRPGRLVEAGQLVAHSGNTGRSTAPHLHYELHGPGGRLLDPFREEPTVRRRLQDAELEAFRKTKAHLNARLAGP